MNDKNLTKGLKNFFKIIESNKPMIQKILFSAEMALKLQYYPEIIPLERKQEKVRIEHEDPLGDVHSTMEDIDIFYLSNIPVEINFSIREGAIILLNNNTTIIIKGI
jgi:hypothetical protein